jgi:DNA replication protein DnaC
LLTHPTLDQLRVLGLHGMAKAFERLSASEEANALNHAEWLGLLLDREMTFRKEKRLAARLRYAKLRHQARLEDVDYRSSRGLDKALFQKLGEGEWIKANDNLAIRAASHRPLARRNWRSHLRRCHPRPPRS